MTVPQGRVEATFDLALSLRPKILRPGRIAAHGAGNAPDLSRDAERGEFLAVGGFVAGFAVRPPQLELVHKAEGSRKAVRRGRLREVVQLAGIGVETALVGTDPGGQEEALVVRQELLLGEEAQILDQRSEEHTSELQSRLHLVCRLLLEKKK